MLRCFQDLNETALLIFEQNDFAEVLSNFLPFNLFICQFAIVEQPDLAVANGNCLDDMKAMIA